MKRVLLYGTLALLTIAAFSAGCRGCQKEDAQIPPRCGECLQLKTGEVCTVRGTMKNSCLAICVSAKILCNGSCPCSDGK